MNILALPFMCTISSTGGMMSEIQTAVLDNVVCSVVSGFWHLRAVHIGCKRCPAKKMIMTVYQLEFYCILYFYALILNKKMLLGMPWSFYFHKWLTAVYGVKITLRHRTNAVYFCYMNSSVCLCCLLWNMVCCPEYLQNHLHQMLMILNYSTRNVYFI